MTIADLQSVLSFRGWILAPQRGRHPPLTPRERQIVDSVLDGRTTKEIAFDLGISDATARVLYSRAMRKLGRSKRSTKNTKNEK